MMLQYWVIQFVPDPLRGEGRNVALVTHDGQYASLRALGLDRNGRFDLGPFTTLAGTHAPSAWVYGEWVRWLQDLTLHEGQSMERLDAILNDVAARGLHFSALPAGTVEAPKTADPERATSWLFRRLIRKVRRPSVRTFDAEVEDALTRSKLALRADFMRDVEVEILTKSDAPPMVLRFAFLLEERPRIGFKVVRPHAGTASYGRQINDAVYTFEEAVTCGFLERSHCFVLTKKPSEGRRPLIEVLSRSATVVDVGLPDAWRTIHAVTAPH